MIDREGVCLAGLCPKASPFTFLRVRFHSHHLQTQPPSSPIHSSHNHFCLASDLRLPEFGHTNYSNFRAEKTLKTKLLGAFKKKGDEAKIFDQGREGGIDFWFFKTPTVARERGGGEGEGEYTIFKPDVCFCRC